MAESGGAEHGEIDHLPFRVMVVGGLSEVEDSLRRRRRALILASRS